MTDRSSPPSDSAVTPRRRWLLRTAAAGVATLAGCDEFVPSSDESPTASSAPTESTPPPTGTESTETGAKSTPSGTVVFTDTPTTSTPSGAVFDGGGIDAFVDAVRAAPDTDGGRLLVEEGTYRFESLIGERPGSNPHADIQHIEDVTVEGNGARFVFTVPWRGGLRFAYGSGLTIRDLTLDYDPVPFTQGRIVGLSDGGRTVTLELDEGSLAARFTRISLLDADGTPVLTVDIGEEADGLRFGEGVYDVERIDGDGWRWFGGPADTATFYLFDDDLADAATLEMRGKAIEDGIIATVRVDGQRRGEIAFEEGSLRTYRVSLTSS